MKNVMVDLETYGQGPGCPILSIGAVIFDDEELAIHPVEFYEVVSLESCHEAGLVDDADTVKWWSEQKDEAKQILTQIHLPTALKLSDALGKFNEYLSTSGQNPDLMKVWGNGADFDNAILQHCFKQVGMQAGWKFWNNRCYRTMKSLPKVKHIKMARGGVHHNALDDARSQAYHLLDILENLKNG